MSRASGPRAIEVDGGTFRWVVRTPPGASRADYPGFVVVDVWDEANRGRGQHLHVHVRFDDPWIHFGALVTTPAARRDEVWALAPVTPGRVAGWIRAALARGWTPAVKAAALQLEGDQPAA